MIVLVYGLCQLAVFFWGAAGLALSNAKRIGLRPPPLIRNVYHELRPFYWPAVVVGLLLGATTEASVVAGIKVLLDALVWLLFRNADDDDRWKRRRRRLAQKVAVRGGQLVVVPAGTR